MHFLGTERYKRGGSGWQECSYHVVGDKIEERRLSGPGDSWVVTRYVDIGDNERQTIAEKVRELSRGERQSARGHDELQRLLRSHSSVTGYVSLDEIDSPGRKVTIAASTNFPDPNAMDKVFSDH